MDYDTYMNSLRWNGGYAPSQQARAAMYGTAPGALNTGFWGNYAASQAAGAAAMQDQAQQWKNEGWVNPSTLPQNDRPAYAPPVNTDPTIAGVQGNGMQTQQPAPQTMPGTNNIATIPGSNINGGYVQAAPDPFAGFRVEQLDPSRAFVTPGGISELLNPYQQQVRDQTMSDIERQRQLAQMTTDDQANAAKAFGGNRHGVANALTNDAFAREAGRQYANLNSQGWNTAATLNQANAGNYLSARGQDINQNQGFMQGALQQRQQDTGYAMGQTSNLINAFQVGNNLLNSSGNMDWNSLNQGSSAINGPSNQASTTQDGGSTWNNLFGNLLTGISLVYRG